MSGGMTPEPIAWIYQNATTEHQYLVWHKQTGGRNWMPLFTLTDVQEAILAEREQCAKVCADMYLEGDMDTGLAAEAIRARGGQ